MSLRLTPGFHHSPGGPKGVRAFTASASTLEAAALLRAAEQVNKSRPDALKLIEQTLGRPGARVTVWGTSFKASTDDVRESPWQSPPSCTSAA
ncbi:hypothetical protein ACFCZY_16430 [Streptomyces sp. NPDC056237]|uniref:hypothetical protein n=1 Tax=Streptomyces sp. NPDC056237 TaxID=3345758 RepID=UPI0035E249A1